jgi:hypothetical protein
MQSSLRDGNFLFEMWAVGVDLEATDERGATVPVIMEFYGFYLSQTQITQLVELFCLIFIFSS